jgi:predicted nucleic acid-binding protein
MAAKDNLSQKEIVLVESDFLFGLQVTDGRHSRVIRTLERHKLGEIGIRVLSSAIVEVRSALYSRGLSQKKIEDFFFLMGVILEDYGVEEFVPVEPGDVTIAERMRIEYTELTFFDSLHAAVSKRLNLKLLSSRGIYSRVGVGVLDLDAV